MSVGTNGELDIEKLFNIRQDIEPRQPALADGPVCRCWNCRAIVGERRGKYFVVNSNKVEVGGIPLDASVYRRCRGSGANPACRALNTLPREWLTQSLDTTGSSEPPEQSQSPRQS